MYQQLDPQRVLETTERLARRVHERFPDRGLAGVADEVVAVTRATGELADWLRRPLRSLRLGAWTVTVILVAGLVVLFAQLNLSLRVESAAELFQGIESLVNDVVFAGVAIWFVLSIEGRVKRRRALAMLVRLRALAHVIDMHQLSKDPIRSTSGLEATASSHEQGLQGPLLARYLDYCSELLSVLGKLAAMLAQQFDDPVTLSTVDEIEALTTGLSRKVWQKIMLVERDEGVVAPMATAVVAPPPTPAVPPPEPEASPVLPSPA